MTSIPGYMAGGTVLVLGAYVTYNEFNKLRDTDTPSGTVCRIITVGAAAFTSIMIYTAVTQGADAFLYNGGLGNPPPIPPINGNFTAT